MNGIQRIETRFAQGKAFVAYLTAGDGGLQHTLAAAFALIDGGVSVLEIGVPFSDPVADGPVIQRATARALAAGTRVSAILDLVADIRSKSNIPIILFTYLNPILRVLHTSFFQDAQQAGVDGILLVDCPLEESDRVLQRCVQHAIAPIFVTTPTTPVARIHQIDQQGQGFLYYACRKGTTGMKAGLPADFVTHIQTLRAHARLPVVAGFGIATRAAATQVLQYADGVVVGSLFVQAIEEGMALADLQRLAMQINPLMKEGGV